MRELHYRDRRSGELRVEQVFGERELSFFYEHPIGKRLTDAVFSRAAFNHLYGWLQRSARSRDKVQAFVERLGIDASQAEHPLEAYGSLDDFFTRRLKPEARPIDPDPDHLLAPCDGRTLGYQPIPAAGLTVKESRVSLEVLLDDPRLAARYAGGAALVLRLAPADYHRFHFPAEGRAGPVHRVGGSLHSVHPIALGAGAPSFRNKRAITSLETERFGTVCLIEVGAMVVGTIVQSYTPGGVARGEEKGYFRFGGSTVVVLLEPDRVRLDDDLLAAGAEGVELFVEMGTRVGVAV